jgi:hypothetical protein
VTVTGGGSRDTVVANARNGALASRREAVAAGATAVELSEGDLELQAGDAMAAQARSTEAVARLMAAAQRWTAAERAARDRGAAATKVEPVSAPLSTPPSAAANPAPTAVTPAPRDPPPAAKPTAAESRAEIDRVLAAYESAIESGDLARIRRAYPGLTPQQQSSWEGFFRSARNFRATFATTRFEPADDAAEILIEALYEYDNRSTSRPERHTIQLRMTVRRNDDGAWRLTAVH